jgi:uncharacterized protein (TIGR02145 family)
LGKFILPWSFLQTSQMTRTDSVRRLHFHMQIIMPAVTLRVRLAKNIVMKAKSLLVSALLFLWAGISFGQSPDAFSYQAVVRNSSGDILPGQDVSFRIHILKGNMTGPSVLTEIHSSTTNTFGLVSLEIGSGDNISGDISSIDWGADRYYLSVELDPEGGTSFLEMGTTQLVSVPYSLFSSASGHAGYADSAAYAEGAAYADSAGKVNDADADPLNEIQLLSSSNDTIYLSQGGQVYVGYLDNNTDAQTLLMNGFFLSISNGNEVEIPTLWTVTGADIGYNEGKVTLGTTTGTTQLELADAYAPGGRNIQIGDDAYLSDVDRTNTLGIFGLSDSTKGALQLGANGPALDGAGDTLSLSGMVESRSGGFIFPDGTIQATAVEYQFLSLNFDTIFLTNGGYVIIPPDDDPDPNNELQEISRSGTLVTLSINGSSFIDSVLTETEVDGFVADNGFATKDMQGENISNLAEPVQEQDAATRHYVDELEKKLEDLHDMLFGNYSVTDANGNIYSTIKIGTQLWMGENLRVTVYNDSTPIPHVSNPTDWGNLTSQAYCWYDDDSASYADPYGALYNWYTLAGGDLCPAGWHIPEAEEWSDLATYLGGTNVAGGKLKESGTDHWYSASSGATNESGFTALPGGYRLGNGSYLLITEYGYWWTGTDQTATDAWCRYLDALHDNLYSTMGNKKEGYSIRCVRD